MELVPGALNQSGLFHEPPEILFVQMRTKNCFDVLLKFKQRELCRHQFENDWPVFDLRPNPADCRCQNPAMVKAHR